MRRAFTMIEVLITVLIMLIIALIIVPHNPNTINRGDEVQVKETGARGRVLDYTSLTVKLRIDNGPCAVPRYSEVSFFKDEVTKLAEAK